MVNMRKLMSEVASASPELTKYSSLSFCQPSQIEKVCITWAPTSYNLGYNSTHRGHIRIFIVVFLPFIA